MAECIKKSLFEFRGRGPCSLVRRKDSGAVLILALLLISILTVLTLETIRAMQVEAASSRYFQDGLAAEAVAKSGVQVAMALLAKDAEENEVDHPGEPWALLPQPDELPVELPAGTLEGKVVDEAGKFPVNYLVDEEGALREAHRRVLERLLTGAPFGLEPEEAQGLIAALKDWLDSDSEPTGMWGAEEDYYQSRQPPYPCKNGPITSLAELRLVRNMTEALFCGTDGGPGLKDLLTIYGDGKININTAGPLVLRAMVSPNVSEDTAADWAEAVVSYRQDPMHWDFLGESDWYRNKMPGYNDISLPAELVTTGSLHFSVEMAARVGVGKRSVFAYLERQRPEKQGAGDVEVSVRYWQIY